MSQDRYDYLSLNDESTPTISAAVLTVHSPYPLATVIYSHILQPLVDVVNMQAHRLWLVIRMIFDWPVMSER